jgi:hypothetical protein
MKKPEFKYCSRPGFQMTFENGWTVSVQWHSGAYCDSPRNYKEESKESTTAEIAAWNSEGEWYNFGSDTVLGYQTPEQVVTFMQYVRQFSKTQTNTQS